MQSSRALAVLGALAVVACVACQGQVVSKTAQRGSTIMIPVADSRSASIGYGGTQVGDPQRGRLEYRLDSTTGPALVTRGSGVVVSHHMSRNAFEFFPLEQVFSVVDIPVDAPLGTHSLYVRHIYTDPTTGLEVEAAGPSYPGQITIIDEDVTISLPGGGTQVVSGEPTPFEYWGCSPSCSWKPALQAWLDGAIPAPTIQIALDQAVSAAELTLLYPDGRIDLLHALEGRGSQVQRAAVNMNDDGVGTASLSVIGTGAPFQYVNVLFALDTGQTIPLVASDVAVSVDRAWDADGVQVQASVSSVVLF